MISKEAKQRRDAYLAATIRQLMEKEAGPEAEYLAPLNPLNLLGGSPIGATTAAFTDTRTAKEQRAAEKAGISNVLIPGRAAYNWMKRLGTANTDLNKKGAPSAYLSAAAELLGSVPAGLAIGETLRQSGVNPIARVAVGMAPGLAGALTALMTETRTEKEQLAYEKSPERRLANLLPGVGVYNAFKRVGYAADKYK